MEMAATCFKSSSLSCPPILNPLTEKKGSLDGKRGHSNKGGWVCQFDAEDVEDAEDAVTM